MDSEANSVLAARNSSLSTPFRSWLIWNRTFIIYIPSLSPFPMNFLDALVDAPVICFSSLFPYDEDFLCYALKFDEVLL